MISKNVLQEAVKLGVKIRTYKNGLYSQVYITAPADGPGLVQKVVSSMGAVSDFEVYRTILEVKADYERFGDR